MGDLEYSLNTTLLLEFIKKKWSGVKEYNRFGGCYNEEKNGFC